MPPASGMGAGRWAHGNVRLPRAAGPSSPVWVFLPEQNHELSTDARLGPGRRRGPVYVQSRQPYPNSAGSNRRNKDEGNREEEDRERRENDAGNTVRRRDCQDQAGHRGRRDLHDAKPRRLHPQGRTATWSDQGEDLGEDRSSKGKSRWRIANKEGQDRGILTRGKKPGKNPGYKRKIKEGKGRREYLQ